MVFVCSPYAGCVKENVQNARKYSRFAFLQGKMPITPHLLYPRFLDDSHIAERAAGQDMGIQLLDLCTELWVFGETISSGMRREIKHARKRGMTIRYFDSECEEATSHGDKKGVPAGTD